MKKLDGYNFAPFPQLDYLEQLNKQGVKYLAFGDFAINALEQGRLVQNIKLWIEPTPQNLEKVNEAHKMLGLPTLAGELTQKKAMGVPNDQKIDIYPAINGFEQKDFETLYNRRANYPAMLSDPSVAAKDKSKVSVSHLPLDALYTNVQHTPTASQLYNLKTLYSLGEIMGQRLNPPETLPLPVNGQNNGKARNNDQHSIEQKGKNPLRDFEYVKKNLDIETALLHYGYVLSEKNKPNDMWRIYKTGYEADSSRLAVMQNPKGDYKGFVDLNNRDFRGDVIRFVEHMEKGDWKRVFGSIEQMMGQPPAQQAHHQPLKVSQNNFLNDEKLRQVDLIEQHKIDRPTAESTAYLLGRSLNETTLNDPVFSGKILSSKSANGQYENAAFPLQSQQGNFVSYDIRNVNFKQYPQGERGEALWVSNSFAQTKTDISTDTGILPKGTQGVETRQGLLVNGTLHKIPAQDLEKVSANRVMIFESPIDALSYHQLSPPKEGEKRMYVSTAGQPAQAAGVHLEKILEENPQAQLVLGLDGDNPGMRHALNLLGTAHPQRQGQRLNATMYYVDATPQEGHRTGHNLLKLEIARPNEVGNNIKNEAAVDRLMANINRFSTEKAEIVGRRQLTEPKTGQTITQAEIKVPNQTKLIKASLHGLERELQRMDGKELTAVVRLSANEKDFNNVLQERKGQALHKSSNLHPPLLEEPTLKQTQGAKLKL